MSGFSSNSFAIWVSLIDMKRITRPVPLLTAVAFLGVSSLAQAQAPQASPASCSMCNAKEAHHDAADPMQYLTKRLDLSPEQQAQIKPVLEAALPVFKKIHEEEKAKMEGAMEVAVSEVKASLSAEQKEGLDKILAEMHEHEMQMEGAMHEHGGPGPGHMWHPHADAKPGPAASASPVGP